MKDLQTQSGILETDLGRKGFGVSGRQPPLVSLGAVASAVFACGFRIPTSSINPPRCVPLTELRGKILSPVGGG